MPRFLGTSPVEGVALGSFHSPSSQQHILRSNPLVWLALVVSCSLSLKAQTSTTFTYTGPALNEQLSYLGLSDPTLCAGPPAGMTCIPGNVTATVIYTGISIIDLRPGR